MQFPRVFAQLWMGILQVWMQIVQLGYQIVHEQLLIELSLEMIEIVVYYRVLLGFALAVCLLTAMCCVGVALGGEQTRVAHLLVTNTTGVFGSTSIPHYNLTTPTRIHFPGSYHSHVSRASATGVVDLLCKTFQMCVTSDSGISPTPHEMLIVSLVSGSIAATTLVLRYVNALWNNRKMFNDDWMMIPSFAFYVILLVFINVTQRYQTNLYPAEDQSTILANPTDVANRILGSKLVIGLEQSMLLTIWGVKICIWFFMVRLGGRLSGEMLVLKWVLGYIIASLVVIEVAYFGVLCRPFAQYWALPVQNVQCATYGTYNVLQMTVNVSSDWMLIGFPLYIVWKARTTWQRKLVMSVVLSMATVTIIAALLNKYYNLAYPLTTLYQVNYVAEASTAIFVGNFIPCWQLAIKVFDLRQPWGSQPASSNSNRDLEADPVRHGRVRDRVAEFEWRRLRYTILMTLSGIADNVEDAASVIKLAVMRRVASRGTSEGAAQDAAGTNGATSNGEEEEYELRTISGNSAVAASDGEDEDGEEEDGEEEDDESGDMSGSTADAVTVPIPVYLRERPLLDGSCTY